MDILQMIGGHSVEIDIDDAVQMKQRWAQRIQKKNTKPRPCISGTMFSRRNNRRSKQNSLTPISPQSPFCHWTRYSDCEIFWSLILRLVSGRVPARDIQRMWTNTHRTRPGLSDWNALVRFVRGDDDHLALFSVREKAAKVMTWYF